MKSRIMNISVSIFFMLSLLGNLLPVKADETPFQSPDRDGDALSNDMETTGWYNLSGGPYTTDPNDLDSDDDGLTDGEEKLFDTDPLDSHDPGIAAKYNNDLKTLQYFSTTDPAYLSVTQGGDQYLLTEALVVRRGANLTITGPAAGSLTITGNRMTAITPVRDPAGGGWKVSFPVNGTVGTYSAIVTDGIWTKSIPVYVIFEIPADLPQDQIKAFLYDDDPSNKKDEVAVWWRIWDWPYYNYHNTNIPECPLSDPSLPCSLWQYHITYGFAQAYWTEQYTRLALVDNAIKAIHGKNSQEDAIPVIADWTDTEFRTRSGRIQNNLTSALYRWDDGTGITMSGGYCETTSTTYTAILRSAGIPARPFTKDYNKTKGHGEGGMIDLIYEYDHATMMWYNGTWYGQRAFGGNEEKDLYYPWYGVDSDGNERTEPYHQDVLPLKQYTSTYSYNDYYADLITSVNQGWTFQDGSDGGGTVNQVWPIPTAEFENINRDYVWDSKIPLRITQSPHVDILNCQLWKGDNWAPSEWRNPVVSNPADPPRDETLTYILPAGVPNPSTPLENWPYNPEVVACSPSTPVEECNSFMASWSTICPLIVGQPSSNLLVESNGLAQSTDSGNFQVANIELGRILNENVFDRDQDGYFDELQILVEMTSDTPGDFLVGGSIAIGEKLINADPTNISLSTGIQTIPISFDGQQIADFQVNGPYWLKNIWVTSQDDSNSDVSGNQILANRDYLYETLAYQFNQFETLSATILEEEITHRGSDKDSNGYYDSLIVEVPFEIIVPDTFALEGDLYTEKGDFVGKATWTGRGPHAELEFDVVNTTPPYTLEHLLLTVNNGELLDSRYAPVYEITDLIGKIENGSVSLSLPEAESPGLMDVSPGTISWTTQDDDHDGLYDSIIANITVAVTDSGGVYRVEGLLEDDFGTEVVWAVSLPQTLVVGTQIMRLQFDGKMIYDQLPLLGTRSFKLVALKIFSDNLSAATLEAEAKVASLTPPYARNQFESSSSSYKLFYDDLENGTSKWDWELPFTGLTTDVWHSFSHAWFVSSIGTKDGSLMTLSPLDFTNYASPSIRFANAYLMASVNDKGTLEVSTDGEIWDTLATYTGTTFHWSIDEVDLSAFGETDDVQIRFRAQSKNSLLWYLDDIYINAWPAIKTAYFITSPTTISAYEDVTLSASYTSVDMTTPVTYHWDFCGAQASTTSPEITHQFLDEGECLVTLTVESVYDNAVYSRTLMVNPALDRYVLTVVQPVGGLITPPTAVYDIDTHVTLTASANTGYHFVNWTGDCSGQSNPCALIMDADKTVSAIFERNTVILTVNITGNGSVLQNPLPPYLYGAIVQLTALPAPGWHFIRWEGDLTGAVNPTTITLTGNKTVTAVLAPEMAFFNYLPVINR